MSLVSALVLGFVLGMRHATDSDHVVAVSTIVGREPRLRSAAWVGALWGAGHTVTVFAVGVAIVVFELVVPARVGLGLELGVGLMLVLLGWMNLRRPVGSGHAGHVHGVKSRLPGQWIRPIAIGLVHGLAGSAAVALLVLMTVRDPRWAATYLLLFGLGTVAGMVVITVAMASALRMAGERWQWLQRRLGMLTGVMSIAFGLVVVYRIGFVQGLFTAHPVWTPR